MRQLVRVCWSPALAFFVAVWRFKVGCHAQPGWALDVLLTLADAGHRWCNVQQDSDGRRMGEGLCS